MCGHRSLISFPTSPLVYGIFPSGGDGHVITSRDSVVGSPVSAWRTLKRSQLFPLPPLTNRRWAHEICAGDNEERAIVIASMNEMAYVFQAWLPLLVWQQVDAPQYQKGFITISFLSFALIVTAFVTKYLWKRELR